ncbi:MAG: MEKHLA domain-containing protein [Pseudanabaenaceae cyanobacterium bins.39]|nr:MEKHLA domain-containing protein [Pseudanabaenaceae cyanobacterium bins.39]
MMTDQDCPWLQSDLIAHVQMLMYSFKYWTGKTLGDLMQVDNITPKELAQKIFLADFVLVSHGTEVDPVLNYGNQKALDLWQMDWHTFTQTPSRYTAEPMERADREQLLAQAKSQGYINNYRGVRIASNGDRFYIDQAIIWNVVDATGQLWGQAATFREWEAIQKD